MKRIILTGGGTAGHVTPNIALMPALEKKGFDIRYIGSKNGMEREMIRAVHVPITAFLPENYAVISMLRTLPIRSGC